MAQAKSRISCEECGKSLKNTPANVSAHMRSQHGIYQRDKRNGTGPTIKGFKRMDGFILLEDDQGNLWLAERIK